MSKKNQTAGWITKAVLAGAISSTALSTEASDLLSFNELGSGAEIRTHLLEMNDPIEAHVSMSIAEFMISENKCGEGKCGGEKKKRKRKKKEKQKKKPRKKAKQLKVSVAKENAGAKKPKRKRRKKKAKPKRPSVVKANAVVCNNTKNYPPCTGAPLPRYLLPLPDQTMRTQTNNLSNP